MCKTLENGVLEVIVVIPSGHVAHHVMRKLQQSYTGAP